MIWKTLSSEYLSRHIYFTARRDVCQREDGTIIDPYFVVELPPSATALSITDNGKAVMVKQYRHPVNEVLYETPGGFIDEGEDRETGMRRELLEETGYTFRNIEYLGTVAANPGLLTNYTHLFLATGGEKTGTQHLDHNEEIAVELVDLPELTAMVMRGEIKQSLHMNVILLGLLKLGLLKPS